MSLCDDQLTDFREFREPPPVFNGRNSLTDHKKTSYVPLHITLHLGDQLHSSNLISLLHTLFFIRNSFIRNLYWDGQIAKKLSVLKPQRLRNF